MSKSNQDLINMFKLDDNHKYWHSIESNKFIYYDTHSKEYAIIIVSYGTDGPTYQLFREVGKFHD